MILLCGIPSESPLAMVAAALEAEGVPHRVLNQRRVAEYRIAFTIDAGGVDGSLTLGAETLRLSDIRGVYLRLMDDRLLPELAGLEEGHPARRHARGFHDALLRWSEVAPGCVVNRGEPQGSNSSKPYQAQLIARHGLLVPETLITNDPAQALEFRQRHGSVIYKSISGVRSIVTELTDADLDRLERIRWCPVQFQERIRGADLRVHVVGGTAIATEIVSEAIDYRYARKQGMEARLRPAALPEDAAARCVALTAALGLEFAGIDLKRTEAGELYCLEVNPAPAFSYFEANTDQPIAATLTRHLARGATA